MYLGRFIFRMIASLVVASTNFLSIFGIIAFAEEALLIDSDFLTGKKVHLKSFWLGTDSLPKDTEILVLAGHADSQGLPGAGTSGEAVDLQGARPMDPKISDELFWNMKIRDAVVELGLQKGLNIVSYDPESRNIVDGNDPKTNWSVGASHVRRGGYAFEIHFDSYGEYGFGSGLIPALSKNLNMLDESLARSFGRYPLFFRGGLGAPRRGIRILEIGKLEGKLEKKLRNSSSRGKTIHAIALRIVQSLNDGLKGDMAFNPQPDEVDTSSQEIDQITIPVVE